MKKPKRFSLAVKVNLVIMALVLSISVLLTLISENTYQETVFRPYFLKLESVDISADELTPSVQEFKQYLGTEELNQIISYNGEKELLLHMKKTVDGFAQNAAQFDDLTMLCLEYRGPADLGER